MWIEIPDEIEGELNNINNPMDKSALAINTLLESMLKGQHIVYASRKLFDFIAGLDYISPANKAFICWIKQKYLYLYDCKNIIDYKIVVTVNIDVINVVNRVYYVPLVYFHDLRETKLLTEHETDCEFFINIYKFIRKQQNTSDYFGMKFENDSCHGSNVASKICQIAKENRISICILDSDKEMQNAKYGDTYKGANKSYKKINKNHIVLLRVLECREKENLFPPSIYAVISEEHKQFLMILDNFIKNKRIIQYFDIKDGVKYKKYKIKGWKEYYSEVIKQMSNAGIYVVPGDDFTENIDEFICVKGIGDKICSSVCQILLENEQISNKVMSDIGLDNNQKQKILEIKENLKENLPEYMYKEWEQIYTDLFSWGCCISEKKLPNYEM